MSGEPDTTWYVLKVVVTAHIVGEDTEYEQETTAYRVTDKDDLLLENGDVNTAAITEVGEGSKKGDPENITFVNEENGSLKVTKTFAGNTDKLTDDDKANISFTVTGPEWPNGTTIAYTDMDKGVKTFENIKLGEYTVTENIAGDKTYTTTYKVGADGTETAGTEATAEVTTAGITVAFTNTYKKTEATFDVEDIYVHAEKRHRSDTRRGRSADAHGY